MGYTRRTELRKISPAELSKIALILNSQSAWKKLMEYVPLILTDAEHWEDGKQRYRIDDIGLIENTRHHKLASEIFLEEWATSGQIRPTLGHLLQFLVNIELFRAADYVATLLNEPPPTRPSSGPAARVDIELALLEQSYSISQQLFNMDYPETSQLNMNSGPDKQNFDHVVKLDDSVPRNNAIDILSTSAERNHIISTAAERNQTSTSARRNHLPLTCAERNQPLPSVGLNQPSASAGLNQPSTSAGLNQLSTYARLNQPSTSAGLNQPLTSAGLNQPSTSAGLNELSTYARLNQPSTSARQYNIRSTSEGSNSSVFLPNFSHLISNQPDQNLMPMSSSQSDSQDIPNISMLGYSQSHSVSSIPQHSHSNESTDDATSTSSFTISESVASDTSNLPNFSQLNLDNNDDSEQQEFSANIPQLSGLIGTAGRTK